MTTWEYTRDRRKRLTLAWGGLIFSAVGFSCAMHWGIEGLVIPVAIAATLSLFLFFPVNKCEACGDYFFGEGKKPKTCPKCAAESVQPARTIFCLIHEGRGVAVESFLMLLLMVFSIRFSCLAFLLLYVLSGTLLAREKRQMWMNFSAAALFICFVLPIDIDVAGFHGPHYGDHGRGLRIVRYVKGMAKVHYCLEKYGEFIAGGCVVMGNEPKWLLVWGAANGQGLEYFNRLRTKKPISTTNETSVSLSERQ